MRERRIDILPLLSLSPGRTSEREDPKSTTPKINEKLLKVLTFNDFANKVWSEGYRKSLILQGENWISSFPIAVVAPRKTPAMNITNDFSPAAHQGCEPRELTTEERKLRSAGILSVDSDRGMTTDELDLVENGKTTADVIIEMTRETVGSYSHLLKR